MNDVAITRLERDTDRYNQHGKRTGIFGGLIDAVSGKGLDRQAGVFEIIRERAKLFGWTMPWGQPDEALRSRVFLAYQSHHAPPLCVHNVWGGYDSGDQVRGLRRMAVLRAARKGGADAPVHYKAW